MKNVTDLIYYARAYNKYKLLALNMFNWINLPPTIESRYIEKNLYTYGNAFFYNDENLGLLCLPCESSGQLNVNDDPINVIVTGIGVNKTLSVKDGVRILNNDLALPTDYEIKMYSSKMADTQKSIDLNIKQLRFPFFIEGTRENKHSIEKAMEQKEDGKPYVIYNKDLGLNDTKVHILQVPYLADKLNAYKYELEREILTFLGINNTFEKKERLLVDEVNSNNTYIDRNVDIMYFNRKRACEEINKKYGLNIDVIKNNDLYDTYKNSNEVTL